MRDAFAKIGFIPLALGIVLAIAFIAWWNLRLYAWFLASGLGKTTAWMLVWGPFVAVGFWAGWLLLRRNRMRRKGSGR